LPRWLGSTNSTALSLGIVSNFQLGHHFQQPYQRSGLFFRQFLPELLLRRAPLSDQVFAVLVALGGELDQQGSPGFRLRFPRQAKPGAA
jgi:hypothetical protein